MSLRRFFLLALLLSSLPLFAGEVPAFHRGDLIFGVYDPTITGIPQYAFGEWCTPDGRLRGENEEWTTLFFFGRNGFLHASARDAAYRYNVHYQRMVDAATWVRNAQDVTVAADGSTVVADIDTRDQHHDHVYAPAGAVQDRRDRGHESQLRERFLARRPAQALGAVAW